MRLSRSPGGRVGGETQVRLRAETDQPLSPNLALRGDMSSKEAYLDSLVAREQLLGLLTALDGGVNDDLVALLPVDRGGDSVLVAHLEGIDDSC